MGMKSCTSGMVIGYHIDEFTHIWLMEQLVAQ